MAKVTKASEKDMAEQYGFATAFFHSDPQLLSLFKKAIGGNWTTDKFVASLQGSQWFKTHSSAYRNNLAQKTADPATWASRTSQNLATVADQARAMGANLTSAQLKSLSDHALLYGYTDSQIKNSLSSYISQNQSGNFFGRAGTDAATLKQSAYRNGINVSDQSMQTWVRAIEGGDQTTDDYVSWIRDQAKSLAPGAAKQLEAGMDLADIASPYVQSMSKILEKDPSQVDLFDPTIRKALNFKDQAGQVGTQTLGDFENSLRADPRWMQTQNAQDSFSQNAHQILQQFGFLS